MKNLARMTALMALSLALASCGGGGTDTTTPSGGPLAIALFAAAPTQGASPFDSVLTVNITGGQAPFNYAFDFENDGAFDGYVNASFSRTVSRSNTYYYNSADAGGVSTYNAVVRVTDGLGAVVTSAPVTLLVQGTQDFMVVNDPTKTFPYSDNQNPDGSYQFNSGLPVFFQATVTGGAAPFEFHWDFDNDGVMDSNAQVANYSDPATGTAVNTRQYTYTYNSPGGRPFTCHLDVVDGTGARAAYDFVIVVIGPGTTGPPPPEFEILLNTSPAASGGVVTLPYDPTGANANLPNQPRLDMSVVVNPDPAKGGVPPFEYYWDFENDGAIDSQAPSPTIPYYNNNILMTVNPYLVNQDDKTFTLKVMVIDSAGQVRFKTATIRVIRATGRPPGVLSADILADADGSGNPYADVANDLTSHDVDFSVSVSGSTGIFQWQLDIDNDGNPDLPIVNGVPGWSDEFGGGNPTNVSTQNFSVTFGPYDDDNDANTPDVVDYRSPGYWPCRFSIRSLASSGGAQEDAMVAYAPVSLVELNSGLAYDGNLTRRTDHGVASTWSVQNLGGGNGQSLVSRELIIVNGAVGTTQLTSEERLTQLYATPGAAGQKEILTDSFTSTRIPSQVARRGAATIALSDSHVFVLGGRNNANGVLGSSEIHAFADGGGTLGWTTGQNFMAADPDSGQLSFYPMYDSCAAIAGTDNTTAVLFGGIFKASPVATAHASAKTFVYTDSGTPGDGSDDGVGDIGRDMITPRYDSAAALVGTDKIYVLGGRTASGQSVATVECLNMPNASDPTTWYWSTAPSMQDARAGCTAQTILGRIYVYGGAYFPDDESQKQLVLTAEVFDPLTGQWSYTVPPDRAVYSPGSAVMPGPGSVSGAGQAGIGINTIMYFGGEGNSGETNNLEEFRYFYTVP